MQQKSPDEQVTVGERFFEGLLETTNKKKIDVTGSWRSPARSANVCLPRLQRVLQLLAILDTTNILKEKHACYQLVIVAWLSVTQATGVQFLPNPLFFLLCLSPCSSLLDDKERDRERGREIRNIKNDLNVSLRFMIFIF
jgi:hypothetical protein